MLDNVLYLPRNTKNNNIGVTISWQVVFPYKIHRIS